MNGKRILIPVDLLNGSFDTLLFVQRMATELPVVTTLLHVVNLNVAAPEGRLYHEVCAESEELLRKLAHLFFRDTTSIRVSVRLGRPHTEIVAEAAAQSSELIILSSPNGSRWKQLLRFGTVQRVVRNAPCPTLVLPHAWRITPEQYLGARPNGHPSAPVCQPDAACTDA
jgi:nucleotide-binding universal stress UspA family protein